MLSGALRSSKGLKEPEGAQAQELSGAPQLLIPVSLSLLRLTHYKVVYAAGALEVQQLKCCPSPATARRPPITISHATAATDGHLQVWRVILPPNSCLLDRFLLL